MNEASIVQYLTGAFEGIDIAVSSGDSFFFYDPGQDQPKDQRFPFATLVTGDTYDTFSNLSRPDVFRLNIGVSRQIFRSLFELPESALETEEPTRDFTALDRIMPHPVYGKMFWVCVLNPSESTFEKVKPLLAEAYGQAAARHAKKGAADW